MAKKSTGKVNAALERALAEELKEVTRKEAEGENQGKFVYSIIERMRVYDRALKLESIKLKADDPEWGKAFGKGDDD